MSEYAGPAPMPPSSVSRNTSRGYRPIVGGPLPSDRAVNRFRHAQPMTGAGRTWWGRRVDAEDLAEDLAAGVLAGATGTAAMAVTGRLYRLAVARHRGVAPEEITDVLDYDDSDHVVVAAGRVVRALTGRAPTSPGGRHALFLATHWGYGSAVGAVHTALRRGLGREPAAGIAFFLGCEAMALALFPVLGDTPVPWRWRRDRLVVSVVQHAVYAGGVAGGRAALARTRWGAPGSAR